MLRFLTTMLTLSIASFAVAEDECLSTDSKNAKKFYEEAFIHSLNGEWDKAEKASNCSLKLHNGQSRWDLEASDFF